MSILPESLERFVDGASEVVRSLSDRRENIVEIAPFLIEKATSHIPETTKVSETTESVPNVVRLADRVMTSQVHTETRALEVEHIAPAIPLRSPDQLSSVPTQPKFADSLLTSGEATSLVDQAAYIESLNAAAHQAIDEGPVQEYPDLDMAA